MIIPAGYAQCNLFFVGAAVPRNAQIAIGVDVDAVTNPVTVASAVGGAFQSSILPLLPEVVTLEKVKAKIGPNDTGPEGSYALGVPGGLADTEPMSPNVAILVSKLNALGGRKNAGKMYIPAFPEADTDGGGLLTTAKLAAWQSACDDFLDALTTVVFPMVILHTDATTPTPVTDLSVQQRLATQKRRLRRAGGRRSTP